MSGIGYDETEGIGQDEADDRWVRPLRDVAEPSPFGGPRSPEPSTLTIFGVTGDLSHRKLIPALYDLACHAVLPPEFTIVGYGRQPLDDDSFRDLMLEAIDDHYGQGDVDGESCERILRAPRYVQGQFDDPEGYRRLGATLDELDRDGGTRGNRMFYLATPPSQFPVIVGQLGRAGLARRRLDAPHRGEALWP
jgi:glucose-6-phosphate 1-dehydrogenase